MTSYSNSDCARPFSSDATPPVTGLASPTRAPTRALDMLLVSFCCCCFFQASDREPWSKRSTESKVLSYYRTHPGKLVEAVIGLSDAERKPVLSKSAFAAAAAAAEARSAKLKQHESEQNQFFHKHRSRLTERYMYGIGQSGYYFTEMDVELIAYIIDRPIAVRFWSFFASLVGVIVSTYAWHQRELLLHMNRYRCTL